MKIFLLSGLILFSSLSFADDEADVEKQIPASPGDKLTIREAKAICKGEGKKGKDLALCIKAKIKK